MKIAAWGGKTWGSALLVAGTSIGAGMLALPLATGASGFLSTSLLFLVCFFFMLLSLFYLVEANLMVSQGNANFITMVGDRIGPWGQLIAWLSFLLLLYSVAAAYISGGGSLIADALSVRWGKEISPNAGALVFLALFGSTVVFGTGMVDAINRAFMIGLGVSFCLLLFIITPHVEWSHYRHGNPASLPYAVPIAILSFTSHVIVPSLCTYLHRDVRKLKCAIFWGSAIPLFFYLIWEFLIIGMLPLTGEYGLEAIGGSSHPVANLTRALYATTRISWIAFIVGAFSFFALVTSFFGVALSLYDFLSDGLHIGKAGKGRYLLLVLMFIPPLLFSLLYPKGFILALGYAGVFVAILYGILPPFMVWKGRYWEKKRVPFRVFGGRALLVVMLVGSSAIIYLQIAATRGWLTSSVAERGGRGPEGDPPSLFSRRVISHVPCTF